jgi:hypothetical protein
MTIWMILFLGAIVALGAVVGPWLPGVAGAVATGMAAGRMYARVKNKDTAKARRSTQQAQ